MTGGHDALFVSSGTQYNLLAMLSHCGRGDEYIAGQDAHTYRYEGGRLPFTVFEEQRRVAQGDIATNKRLGAVLATIQADECKREEEAPASPRVRNRRKERI